MEYFIYNIRHAFFLRKCVDMFLNVGGDRGCDALTMIGISENFDLIETFD